MKEFKFNHNQWVKVRLTDEAIKWHVNNKNNFWENAIKRGGSPNLVDYITTESEYKKKADSEGYHRFQFWDFVQEFGWLFGVGGGCLVDGEIIVEG